MKKVFIAFCLAIFTFTAIAQKTLVVDANAEARELPAFNKIKASGGIDLFISQGDESGVAVSAARAEDIPNIKTIVNNGVLEISFEQTIKVNFRNRKLKVYVSFKDLESLNVSGACDVMISGAINVPSLSVDASGASTLRGKLTVDNLELILRGASDARLSGNVTNATIQSSGASDVDGYGLVIKSCNINASGASDVNISVTDELSVTASGASAISYTGTPVVQANSVTGASSVKKRN